MEYYADAENQATSKRRNKYVTHKGITPKCTKNITPAAEMQSVDLPIQLTSRSYQFIMGYRSGKEEKIKREGKPKENNKKRGPQTKTKYEI